MYESWDGIKLTSSIYKISFLKRLLKAMDVDFKVDSKYGLIVPENEAVFIANALVFTPKEGYSFEWDVVDMCNGTINSYL